MAEELEFGIEQYKAGNKEEARRIFLKVIQEHPNYTRAYQWLYNVARNDNERMNILKKILDINPTHEKALELYRELSAKNQPPPPPRISRPAIKQAEIQKPSINNNIVISIFAIIILCIICACIFIFSDWGGKAPKDYKTAAFIICQIYVEDNLKAPSTAKFPSSRDANIIETSKDIFEIHSYVDSQNSFGAMIRTNFYCKLQYTGALDDDEFDGRNWNLLDIKFDE